MDELKSVYTIEELRAIFEQMDWDKNGEISKIEFKSYLAKLEKGENLNAEAVYKAFEEMDLDCSKSLDWTEFVNGMRNMCAPKPTISENDIERIFNEIDDDGNGYITLREAKKAFKQISKRFGLEDKSQIEEWIKECDFDQDGRISLEEFKLGIAGTDLCGHDT